MRRRGACAGRRVCLQGRCGSRGREATIAHTAAPAFISFLQNHDRWQPCLRQPLTTLWGRSLRALAQCSLLFTAVPSGQGEEWVRRAVKFFATSAGRDLKQKVVEGRAASSRIP